MREILFRGKQVENGEWAYGTLLKDGEAHRPQNRPDMPFSDYYIVPKTERNNAVTTLSGGRWILSTIAYHILPETVGQYTGLTDKNGKKIFKGDICRFREWKLGDMCWIGKVYFEHQHFVISGEANKECETPFTMVMSCFASGDIEVIGNIHDNPELLGGANNG